MHTLTYTINGSSVVKCLTLNRANAEAIANGRRVIAVHDGYLLLPCPKPAFTSRWNATKSAMLITELAQAQADTLHAIAAFN